MVIKIFEKIEVLLISKVLDKSFPNIEKISFLNASLLFSGNFMVITIQNEEQATSYVYSLDTIKSYKTQ